jgi:hypothetical protein
MVIMVCEIANRNALVIIRVRLKSYTRLCSTDIFQIRRVRVRYVSVSVSDTATPTQHL